MADTKIPIKVRHLSSNQQLSNEIPSSYNRLSSASNGISPRLRDSTGDLFNMTRLNDETDNIHSRMKEFEERCKKWREEFFSQTSSPSSSIGVTGATTSTIHDFDQRVPPLSPRFSSSTLIGNNNNNNLSTPSSNNTSSSLATKPFSTLNKTYYQDTNDGGKKYIIEFDIGDFKSNEISVNIQGKSLIVKGDREIKAGSATETKNFNREISLPDHIDTSTLTSYLIDKNPIGSTTSSSILYVEAFVIADKYYSRRSRLSPSPPTIPVSQTQTQTQSVPLSSISTNNNNNNNNSIRNSRLVPSSISPSRINNSNNNNNYSSQFSASKSSKSGYSSTTHTSTSASASGDRGGVGGGGGGGGITTALTSTLIGSKLNDNNNNSTATKSFSNLGSTRTSIEQPQTKSFSSLSNINNQQQQTNILSACVPDLMNGPTFNKDDGYTIYKFDFNGYDQSEIHLSITESKALEVKATKIISDNIGKTYKEFKREIQLGEFVDINLIKNVLVDGILTIKIPSNELLTINTNNTNNNNKLSSPQPPSPPPPPPIPQTSPPSSLPSQVIIQSANNNLSKHNSFHEIKSQDGRLLKLQTDLNGYDPENLKIVLTANNVLKVTAEQINNKNGTQINTMKFNQEYTLPNYIQPENMKAIMSRDGILTIDFQANNINDINNNNNNTSPSTTSYQQQQQQQQQQPRNSLKA
jgi:HSP20 family molecular chaperone IbpA